MAIDPNGTLLQVAYGGYLLVDPATEVKEELVYVEPGFTAIGTIEYALDKADQFYFIIRKRSDIYGTVFDDIDSSDIIVSITDATIGSRLDAIVSNFNSSLSYYDADWEDGLADSKKVVVAINSGVPISSPSDRIRIIDCNIRDRTDDSVVFFRVLIDDSSKTFHFLSVRSNEPVNRNIYSTAGSSIASSVDGKGDFYVLISPFASFYESPDGGYDFAYPLNTRFYKRQDTYNQEDFSYHIIKYSHRELEDAIRVSNVPGYPQMGVIIVDRGMYDNLSSVIGASYVDVGVRGLMSDMRDAFRMNLTKV